MLWNTEGGVLLELIVEVFVAPDARLLSMVWGGRLSVRALGLIVMPGTCSLEPTLTGCLRGIESGICS